MNRSGLILHEGKWVTSIPAKATKSKQAKSDAGKKTGMKSKKGGRKKALSEKQFWEVVAALDGKYDALSTAFDRQSKKLQNRIKAWAKKTKSDIQPDFDIEGISLHVVGLGKEAYNEALCDPAAIWRHSVLQSVKRKK